VILTLSWIIQEKVFILLLLKKTVILSTPFGTYEQIKREI